MGNSEYFDCSSYDVTNPDNATSTVIIVTLGFTPGNAHRCDQRALKNFIFMRQQHTTAQPIHSAAVASPIAEVEFGTYDCTLPLANIRLPMYLKRLGQGLEQLSGSALIAATTGNGDCEFTAA